MAAAASGFMPASEPGLSPSREAELEDLCSRQAEQIERLQDLAPEPQQPTRQPQAAIIRPEEKQALVQLLSDLSKKVEDLEKLTAKQAREIEDLKVAKKDAEEDIEQIREHFPRLIMETKARLKAIEEKGKPQKTDATLAHINALASELLARAKAGQRGVTYAEAAKILRLDKSRVCQLRGLIASDSRFNIDWHPNRKNTKVICLKNYKTKEIVELNVQ
jgi:chromosome segregation ATPase